MLSLLFVLILPVAFAEDAWVTESLALRRWPTGTQPVAFVSSVQGGEKVEVLLREGSEARVRAGSEFGWVDVSKLSAEPVAAEDIPVTPPPAGLPLPPIEAPSP